VTAVDLKTGNVAWEISVFDVNKQERSIASPVIAGDLILGSCGFVTAQKHFVAVRPPAKDGERPKEVWRLEKKVSYLPTPLVKGDRIFLCSEEGFATCLDVKTGKQIWQERIGDGFSASPVCAGDRIYCVSNDGVVVTLAASDKFQVLGQSPLGEPTQSTPAISGGRMFLRTEGHLIAVGKK
jgi:outer membrane protein assembly factor BamB